MEVGLIYEMHRAIQSTGLQIFFDVDVLNIKAKQMF